MFQNLDVSRIKHAVKEPIFKQVVSNFRRKM